MFVRGVINEVLDYNVPLLCLLLFGPEFSIVVLLMIAYKLFPALSSFEFSLYQCQMVQVDESTGKYYQREGADHTRENTEDVLIN